MFSFAKEDEEWKEFEQKEVDYSGLRLQALQIRWEENVFLLSFGSQAWRLLDEACGFDCVCMWMNENHLSHGDEADLVFAVSWFTMYN